MLSTTVASPCQTLRELLRDTTSKGIKSPAVVPRMRSSPRVCTLVLFIIVVLQTYYCSIARLPLPFPPLITENTIVVCSQEADNVVVTSKPLTVAVLEICAGDIYVWYNDTSNSFFSIDVLGKLGKSSLQ